MNRRKQSFASKLANADIKRPPQEDAQLLATPRLINHSSGTEARIRASFNGDMRRLAFEKLLVRVRRREFLGTCGLPDSFSLRAPIFRSGVGEVEMIALLKCETDQNDRDERKHQEMALDEALKNTFPASDPVSVELPTPPATDRERATRSGSHRGSNSDEPGKGRLAVRGGALAARGVAAAVRRRHP